MRHIRDTIAFLIITNHAQGRSGIKNRFWQNAGKQQPNLIDRQSRSLIFDLYSQTGQEVMCKGYEQYMVMQAQPTAVFIVVETDFTLPFFEDDFDGPTHTADPNKVKQGNVCRGLLK